MTGLWWWLAFMTGLGLTVGSFLNVVMYRLPLGLSVFRPLRSFCPHCEGEIHWYDNLPLLSFALRAGHCRHCGGTISLQYPIVEVLTALLFLLVFETFFVAQVRHEFEYPQWLGDRLEYHWPILLAHLVMVAGLLAVSGTDIREYWLDIRITWLIIFAGTLLHTLWTPTFHGKEAWWRPGPTLAATCLAIGLVRLITWLVYDRTHPIEPDTEPFPKMPDGISDDLFDVALMQGTATLEPTGNSVAEPVDNPIGCKISQRIGRLPIVLTGWFFVVVAVGVPVWIWLDRDHQGFTQGYVIRAVGVLTACFVTMLAASFRQRPADRDIVNAIEEEKVTARRVAAGELLRVAPALLAGVAVVYALGIYPQAQATWLETLRYAPIGGWQPLTGLSTAITGLVLAGGLAWGTRISFTGLLGKEALGFGDVHILAAAGTVAGAGAAILGFFAASVLALLGLVVMLPAKRSRVIPFGPWLALGVVVLVVAYSPVAGYFEPLVEAAQFLLGRMVTGGGFELP